MVGTVQVLMADETSTGLDSATTEEEGGHLRTLDALMASQFGGQTTSYIVNPATQQFKNVPSYIETTYGWAYSDRFLAYGILWVFNLVLLAATAVGLGRINFTRW